MSQSSYKTFRSHDGTPIAYRVSGQGAPVVLVHGFTVTSTVNFATHYRDDGSGGLVALDGPTVASALVDAGRQVVLFDLRGHGHSGKPHDADRYSMEAFVGDVRALVDHLGLDRVALVGYSFGATICGFFLSDGWVAGAALCGIGAQADGGDDPGQKASLEAMSKCFLEGCWDDHPDVKPFRSYATLDPDADFVALGLVARGLVARGLSPVGRLLPIEMLKSASVPVLVLNGGADFGATDEHDVARFVPGARRVVVGESHHGNAPSDPGFQGELVRFILELDC